jgi:hypothetical protein
MSNDVTLLVGYEMVISGGSVGEPDKMYGAIAKLFPENGCIDTFKGVPYTKAEYFRLRADLADGVVHGIGGFILFVRRFHYQGDTRVAIR